MRGVLTHRWNLRAPGKADGGQLPSPAPQPAVSTMEARLQRGGPRLFPRAAGLPEIASQPGLGCCWVVVPGGRLPLAPWTPKPQDRMQAAGGDLGRGLPSCPTSRVWSDFLCQAVVGGVPGHGASYHPSWDTHPPLEAGAAPGLHCATGKLACPDHLLCAESWGGASHLHSNSGI